MNENNISSTSNIAFLLKVLAVIAGIPVLFLFAIYLLFWWSMSGITYDYFGKHRTREMESTFGITVDDNVRLVHYYGFIGYDIDEHLDIEVSDYRKFIESNISYTPDEIETKDNGEIWINYFTESNGNPDNRIGIAIDTEQNESGKYKVVLWTPYKDYN